MKKLIAMILVLASVFSMTANAFSFFPEIEVKKENKGFALDYGTVFEVEADKVEKQDDGSTVLYYAGVETYAYQAYGEALSEDGYEAVYSEQGDNYVLIQVEKSTDQEEIDFCVQYFFNDKIIALIIPEGVGIASMDVMSKFKGYTEIKMNQWFNLPGIGKMRFTDFELNKEINITYYYSGTGFGYSSMEGPLNGTANTYILGEFDNTSSASVQNYKLPNVQLHYINEDNEYTYDQKVKGAFTGSKIYNSSKTSNMFDLVGAPTYPSLQISDIGYAYRDIPDRVLTSTDGSIVITIDYEGESYALYIRK